MGVSVKNRCIGEKHGYISEKDYLYANNKLKNLK